MAENLQEFDENHPLPQSKVRDDQIGKPLEQDVEEES